MKRFLEDISGNMDSRLARLVLVFALIGISGWTSPAARQTDPAPLTEAGRVQAPGPAIQSTGEEPPGVTEADQPVAPVAPVAAETTAGAPRFIVAGWLPFWDLDEGLRVIREFPAAFDEVSPFWYKVTDDGHVVVSPGAGALSFTGTLRSMGKRIFPTISGFDKETMGPLLNDPQKRAFHIDRVVELVVSRDFDGIDIDYESLRPEDRNAYSLFITELAAALHARDKKLITTVHAKTSYPGSPGTSYAHDYGPIGRASDHVRIMAYDQHYSGGPAGPVASLAWVDKVVAHAVKNIPREKIVLGLPAYGYDWPTGGGHGKSVVHDDVAALSAAKGAPIQWDDAAGSPFLHYSEGKQQRTIWFENHRSLSAKIDLARRYELGGVVIWRLGREDKAIYGLLSER